MKTTWFWLLIVVMVALGGYSEWQFFGPVHDVAVQVSTIPPAFGPWVGADVTLDERSYEILETRNVLYREYRNEADAAPPVALCIVFTRENRKAPHPPEVCYTGAGAHVDRRPTERVEFTLGILNGPQPANVLQVTHGKNREVVLYWYLAGQELTTSYYGQQLKVMWAQMMGKPASCALIRYSTVITDESFEQAMARLRELAQLSLPSVVETLVSHHGDTSRHDTSR